MKLAKQMTARQFRIASWCMWVGVPIIVLIQNLVFGVSL